MNASCFAHLGIVLALVAVGCSSADAPSATADGVEVDQTEIVHGVADRGRNPAVIALDIGDVALCTGALIAPDVVLTARHCVSTTTEEVSCPPTAPQITGARRASSLKVLVGDDVASAREVARGREIVVPSSDVLCDADIALVVLDRSVDGIDPLDVHQQGIAQGDHVTAVGYGKAGDDAPAGVKLVREHVKVLDTTRSEFLVGEATCQGDSGGPALDEASGEIVGVVSRGGPSCDGRSTHNVYTRADAFSSLIDEALAKSSAKRPPKKGGGTANDMGGACTHGSDCASGVCVKASGRQYCSRPCDPSDHCPTHFRCTKASSGASVCIEH